MPTKFITFLIGLLPYISTIAQHKAIAGFAPGNTSSQQKMEAIFDKNLNASNISNTIRELSAFPHELGSKGSKAVANNILNRFKSYGFDAKLETYTVLFPTPKIRVLEMVAPKSYKALLKEHPLKEDATSLQPDQLPTYNAWSADGDITGDLVFVNYGLPADYDMITRMGIDVKGKIVIAKYGRSWRGIKPKIAQEHGAIGCIIYSDPADDGYSQGDVYPEGAFKNEYGVQRGSVMDMPVYPGDPLTPSIAATENAQRISSHNDAPNLLKIPVLPISYHDAIPLLQSLKGPVAPTEWRGTLAFTYHVGPGATKVHMNLQFDWKMVPCYNVIATIQGSELPDEWIVRGNHHDAWVNGAQDPISGVAALLEEAKSIGELLKTGWKPKRTLKYCAWDGEEPGLIGSTEWVEDHAKELQEKCVLYVNSDGYGRGFLFAGGSHALETFMTEVASDIKDPQTNATVLERLKAQRVVNASSVKEKQEALSKSSIQLNALGSGSDFSSFLQHLAVPTLDLGFGGEDNGGEYHSIFDSYDMFRRFKDPSFAYGVALAQTAGHTVLRMANADVLPFDFRNLYTIINDYTDELISMTNDMRSNTKTENELIQTKQYILAADTALHMLLPEPKDEVPYIDFSPLQNALSLLQKSADNLYIKWNQELIVSKDVAAFNKALYKAEQQLLLTNGLPRRNWYKHAIYAPGFYTGYGVKTLPGIREALEQRNWNEAKEQIAAVALVIENLAKYLDSAAK